MRVVVIGAGLLGLASAEALQRRKCDVTIVDRREDVAMETSFANGGLVTPSLCEPWNAPGSLGVLARSLFRENGPLKLRPEAIFGLAGWGIEFLRNTNPAAFAANSQSNLTLALFSLAALRALREEGLEYGEVRRGVLRFFRGPESFETARVAAADLARRGVGAEILTTRQTIALEPALGPLESQLAGALHHPDDESGDARLFACALAQRIERRGGRLVFGAEVAPLERRGGAIAGLTTSKGRFEADHYVVASGSYSSALLERVGVALPIAPAKGYSITFPNVAGHAMPRQPVIDDALHAVVTPLQAGVRVAGTAEFAGFNLEQKLGRLNNLLVDQI